MQTDYGTGMIGVQERFLISILWDSNEDAGKMVAAQSLRNLITILPYTVYAVLTDNGIQFTSRAYDKYAIRRIFDRV